MCIVHEQSKHSKTNRKSRTSIMSNTPRKSRLNRGKCKQNGLSKQMAQNEKERKDQMDQMLT